MVTMTTSITSATISGASIAAPSATGKASALRRARSLRWLGLAAVATALFSPLAATAAPWDWGYGRPAPLPPVPQPSQRWGETAQVYGPDPVVEQAQLDQRCNVGRLVGGLVGGGVGYAASRYDGRTWAVPLGALLGSQMGCQVGSGRGPTLW